MVMLAEFDLGSVPWGELILAAVTIIAAVFGEGTRRGARWKAAANALREVIEEDEDDEIAARGKIERAASRAPQVRNTTTLRKSGPNGAVLGLLVAGLLSLAACTVPESYVRADARKLETIGEEYFRYVTADETLDNDARARRVRSLRTWRLRVESALDAALVLPWLDGWAE